MCEKASDAKQEPQALFLWAAKIAFFFVLIIGIVIFIVWAILQPHKPIFVLDDLTLTQLSLSPSNLLTCNIQLTLSTRNPNERIGIYYEKLDIYASYRNQQVTLATELPSSYQGHKDVTIWSPFVYGNSVPVDPYLAAALNEDLNAGAVVVNVKVDGILKWKVGSWSSGKYRINVNCPAYMTFDSREHGIADRAGNKFQFLQPCDVEVAVN